MLRTVLLAGVAVGVAWSVAISGITIVANRDHTSRVGRVLEESASAAVKDLDDRFRDAESILQRFNVLLARQTTFGTTDDGYLNDFRFVSDDCGRLVSKTDTNLSLLLRPSGVIISNASRDRLLDASQIIGALGSAAMSRVDAVWYMTGESALTVYGVPGGAASCEALGQNEISMLIHDKLAAGATHNVSWTSLYFDPYSRRWVTSAIKLLPAELGGGIVGVDLTVDTVRNELLEDSPLGQVEDFIIDSHGNLILNGSKGLMGPEIGPYSSSDVMSVSALAKDLSDGWTNSVINGHSKIAVSHRLTIVDWQVIRTTEKSRFIDAMPVGLVARATAAIFLAGLVGFLIPFREYRKLLRAGRDAIGDPEAESADAVSGLRDLKDKHQAEIDQLKKVTASVFNRLASSQEDRLGAERWVLREIGIVENETPRRITIDELSRLAFSSARRLSEEIGVSLSIDSDNKHDAVICAVDSSVGIISSILTGCLKRATSRNSVSVSLEYVDSHLYFEIVITRMPRDFKKLRWRDSTPIAAEQSDDLSTAFNLRASFAMRTIVDLGGEITLETIDRSFQFVAVIPVSPA